MDPQLDLTFGDENEIMRPTWHVMGTGSRSLVTSPKRMDVFKVTEERILTMVNQCTQEDFVIISGMAEGFDEALAVIAINHGIPLHVYIPNPTYGWYYWGKRSLTGQNRLAKFNRLVSRATKVTICCEDIYTVNGLGQKYHSNFYRNDMMVDAADEALVYDAGSSGTRQAVQSLHETGTPYSVYPYPDSL